MTLATFFEIQRQRLQQVDGTPEDRQLRLARFKSAKGEKSVSEDPSKLHESHYDGIKAGYRRSRLLYE